MQLRIKIDWNQVTTSLVIIIIAGVLGLSGHLVLRGAIDEVDSLDDRVDRLEDVIVILHEDIDLEDRSDEVPFSKKLWNWITFKEFRK